MLILVPVLFIAATPLRQASAACELCFEGEAITKPDYVLGLTDPVPIQTCEDLVSLLVFIQEGDDLCSAARAVGTLCGCPNRPPNACTICGDRTMTKPLQNLEGLVDLGDVDYFGLAPTCALLESGINVIDKEDQACSTLRMDELQLYCGCPSGDEEENNPNPSMTCTLCPGGEIVPNNPDLKFIFLHLNSNGDRISCSDALRQVDDLERESVLCNDIQRGASSCGCPVREDACDLCPDGVLDVTKASEPIDSLFGVRQDCDTFHHQVQRFGRDSAECKSIDETVIETCCSASNLERVPCTLCPGGEPVAYPDKIIVGMDGFGYDYLEPRCGILDEAVKFADEKDSNCFSARILAKVCGCEIPESSCSICGTVADTPSNPNGQYQWAFDNILETFPEIHDNIDLERPTRCEIADSFLGAVLDKGDEFCYFNQLIRGTACGCHGPESTKVIVLVWAQRCSGLLSLFGSLLIIAFVLTRNAKNRWNTYNQLVLSISVFDALSSISYIFGTTLTPAYLGLYGSVGTDGTCVFQGWLFQLGMTSVYYNVALCFYFLLVVRFKWTERKLKTFRKWAHLGILTVGIMMSLAIIPFVTAGWRWCYVNKPPYHKSWLPGVFFFILPIGCCMIGMTVLMAFFVKYVRQIEEKSNKRRLSGSGCNRRSLANRTLWQSLYFLAVFYMVWPIQFVAFIIPLVESNYWIYLLAALVGPLQGFLNAMVVAYRESKQIQRLLGINYIKDKWSTACLRATEQWSSRFIIKDGFSSAFFFRSSKRANADPNLSPEEIGKDGATPKHQSSVVESVKDSEIVKHEPPAVADSQHEATKGDADIDVSLAFDALSSNDGANRPGHQSYAEHEGDAIVELAMNAGLLDDIDYALYQNSINNLEGASS